MSKSKGKSKNDDGQKKKKKKATNTAAEQSFLARVYVSLKSTVNDPEGITIGGALASLGFDEVQGVRSGRYFQVTLTAADGKHAAGQVDQMCARLLANPVIETYSFDIQKV